MVSYKDVSAVTYENIKGFIDKFNFDRACEFCSNDHWYLWGANHEERENIEIILQKTFSLKSGQGIASPNVTQRFFYACYSLSCSKCGYIRFFSKNAILDSIVKSQDENEGTPNVDK